MEWIAQKVVDDQYIVLAIVDGRLTIYITKTEWNGQIKIHMENGKMIYEDINGDVMLVYEEGEPEFKYYNKITHFNNLPRRLMKNIIR